MARESALKMVPPFLRVCGVCEWYYHSERHGESCIQGELEEPRAYKHCPSFTLHWDIEANVRGEDAPTRTEY